MQELIIDKTFNTKEELEAYENLLANEYHIFMIMHKDQVLGEPEVYGIDRIIHCGKKWLPHPIGWRV